MTSAEGLKVEIDARHIDEVKTRIAQLETERDALRETLGRILERASWIRRDRSYKAPEQLATQESEERLSCVLQEISGLAGLSIDTDFGKPYSDVIAAASAWRKARNVVEDDPADSDAHDHLADARQRLKQAVKCVEDENRDIGYGRTEAVSGKA